MTRTTLLALLAVLAVTLTACGSADEPVVDDPDLQASAAPVTDAGTPDDEDEPAPSPTPTPTSTTDDEPSEDAEEEPAAPTFEEVCAGRDDEAFIEVLEPRPGAVVADPVTVTGCGNTFEANYLYRLEAPDGTVLVEDFGTMSCGNGCVGEFTFEVDAGTTGEVLLTVYESSAQDGSPQNVVEVPITIE